MNRRHIYRSNYEESSSSDASYNTVRPSFCAKLTAKIVGIRPETPLSVITDKVWYPDLSIYCHHCQILVKLQFLQRHKKFHLYLETLGFNESDKPSIDEMMENRKEKVSVATSNLEIDRINSAVEYLKVYMMEELDYTIVIEDEENTPVLLNTDDINSVGLASSARYVDGVGCCSYANPRFCGTMEDTSVFQDAFGTDPEKCYLGLFDGQQGSYAAQLAASELHHALVTEMLRFDPGISCSCTFNLIEPHVDSQSELEPPWTYEVHRPRTEDSERLQLHTSSANLVQQILHTCTEKLDSMAEKVADLTAVKRPADDDTYSMKMCNAFERSYHYTDVLLQRGQNEYAATRWSGCTATTAVFQGCKEQIKNDDKPPLIGKLYVANAGNVTGILLRKNFPYQVTSDHSPRRKKEHKRVIKNGGRISGGLEEPLVNGVMQSTRAIGFHGDLDLKRCLSTTPSFRTVDVDKSCQAFVMASSGVWNVLDVQEVGQIIALSLPCNQHGPTSSYKSLNVADLYSEQDEEIDEEFLKTPCSTMSAGQGRGLSTVNTPGLTTAEPVGESDTGSCYDGDVDTEWTAPLQGLGTPAIPWTVELAEHAARNLVQAAIMAGSKENITVLVMIFPAALRDDWNLSEQED